MEKKKITAGSVDELLEIVRAVRDGKDPDIDEIREEQRRKREEQILERRRKKSGGSADSAGPARASQKGKKGEQKREKDRKEERKQEESPGKPEEPEPEDAQKAEAEESEPEIVMDDFSWPQFDPAKILMERNAKRDEAEKPAGDGGAPDGESGEHEADDSEKGETEEEAEDKKRRGIFRPPWRNFLGTDSEDEQDSEDDEDKEPDEEEPEDGEDEEPDEEEPGDEEDNEPDEEESEDEESDEEKPDKKDIRQDEDDFDDDEFEQMLDDDNTEEEFIKSRETMAAFTSKAAEVFGGLLQKAENAASRSREHPRKKSEGFEELSEDMFPDKKPETKSAGSRTERRRAMDPETEKKSLHNLEKSLEKSLSMWRRGEEPDSNSVREKKTESPTESESGDKIPAGPDVDAPDVPEEKPSPKPAEQKQERRRPQRSRRESEPRRKREFRIPENISSLFGTVKTRVLDGWNSLNQRGIHKREMAMLGIVLLFILLILFFLVAAVRNFFSQKQKSRNVTAEDGLVVTVENEPQDWASSYPVQLKILCKTGSISSVTVNGVSCTPDENGMITLETGDWRLLAQVETDDGTKKAQIEIPMLDNEAPALDIKREEDKIVLSATDARSQVAGIYYAIEDPEKYRQLPLYQKYEEPLSYEKGIIYRFYARDKAGNISTPVVSTLEDAESFTLEQTKMSLFPDETCSLSVKASPEGALLRNLKFKSQDTAVVTVEDNGKVTAVGEGTTEVLVSADGMESQTCTFDVSTERSVLVSAIGDCTLGTDEAFDASTSFNAFDSVKGHDYFFRNVKDILGNDDVTFANFEGTLTDSTAREAKQFAFKGDPSYTEILKDGSVEVVTLANNHSKDYGEQSLEDTKAALKEAGIDYCIGDEIVMREVNGVQVAFIGIYVLDIGLEVQPQVVQTITQARQLGAELVIVAFHWGSEKATTPDETQRSLAHTAIDRGADLVVGHHPHVLQGIEQYNGKYIVYSLANFCFGGNSSPSDMDTMIFQQEFRIGQDGAAESGEISIIPCSISSESGYNNYQPTPAAGSEAERIMGRLNEYSEEFGQTYSAAER